MKKHKYDDLNAIYLSLAEPLYYYLLKLTGSPDVAEELVQETFYRATLSLDLYEHGYVKSWLFMVARNAYLDEWRKRNRWKWVPFNHRLSNSINIVSPHGLPEDHLSAKELSSEVRDIMNLLPESYRSILYLREYEQFTYDELAQTLDLTAAQVKTNLYRARQRFKKLAERLGKNFTRSDEHEMG